MKHFVPMLMIGAIVFSAGCSSSDAPKENSMSENKHESHSMHHDMNGSAKTDNPSTNAYMEVNTVCTAEWVLISREMQILTLCWV